MDNQSSHPNRKRPLRTRMAVTAILIAFCWWTGIAAILPRNSAEQSINAHNLDKAEQHIRVAMRVSRDTAKDYFTLARIHRKQGNLRAFDEALKHATALGLEDRTADNERLLALAQSGQLDAIQSQLDRLLISGEADGREVLEAYVNGCLTAAKLRQAEALINGWSESLPEDGQPDYYRARLLMFYGRKSEAAGSLHSVLSKAPDHYPAAYLMGKIRTEENRPGEALEYFEAASKMTFNAAPQIAVAKTLRSLGRVDEARDILKKAVEVSPRDTAKSFHRVGDRLEGTPAQLELGNLELAVGNNEQAIKWLDIAVKACPEDLSARHARGIALRGAGRNAEATAELKAVKAARLALREVDQLADLIDKNPDLIDERVRIGELYLMHESKKTGEYWLKSALTKAPTHFKAHRLLAELYMKFAETEPAYAQLSEYHKSRSGDNLSDDDAASDSRENKETD